MPAEKETIRFWNRLLHLIEEGRVIPVIGPDLLTIDDGRDGALLYPWLAKSLVANLGLDPDPDLRTLNDVACRYIQSDGPLDDVYIGLKEILAKTTIPTPEPLKRLAEISSFKLFVSTSFDSLLEKAVNEVRRAGRAPVHSLAYSLNNDFDDLPDALANLDRPVVYRLLGRVSAIKQTYAVTDEDTLEFIHSLQAPERRPTRLFDALTDEKSQLLLVGNGFSGWLTRFFLRAIKDKERLWRVRDRAGFVVDQAVSDDAELQDFFRHFSDQTLLYPEASAVRFVDELSRRWRERHPEGPAVLSALPESPQSDPMPRFAAFLSYASEDRPTVAAIKADLDRNGIDAWFDRGELKAGDFWDAKIKANIDSCSVFIAVISASVLRTQAREFRAEWEHALEAIKRRPRRGDGSPARFILPLVIDSTDMQAAGVREYFGAIQAESLPGGRSTPEFRALVQDFVRGAQKSQGIAP